MRRLMWLVLTVLAVAAFAPLAASGQEVVWRHPARGLFEKENFFRPFLSTEEFARTVEVQLRESTDPEGRVSSFFLVRTPVKAWIKAVSCQMANEYFRLEPSPTGVEIGVALIANDLNPTDFQLLDQNRSVIPIPRIQVKTDPIVASNTAVALNLLEPLIEAIRRGDEDGGCAAFLLRTASAFIPTRRSQPFVEVSALVIIVDEVVRVPVRLLFPPPPGPPQFPQPGPAAPGRG